MSPAAIIALVRDALIIGALGYILWFIHRADQNAATVAELKAVEKQLTLNEQTVAKWEAERASAETQRQADMATIAAGIDRNSKPILVYRSTGGGTVSCAPSPPAGGPAGAGGPNPGARESVDVRPAINALELKYESALATCRSVLAEWPQ